MPAEGALRPLAQRLFLRRRDATSAAAAASAGAIGTFFRSVAMTQRQGVGSARLRASVADAGFHEDRRVGARIARARVARVARLGVFADVGVGVGAPRFE